MRLLILLALLCACTGTRAADDWSARDAALESVYIGTLIIDAKQTMTVRDNPTIRESNPVLGPRPSEAKVKNYFTASALIHMAVTDALAPRYRPYFQVGFILYEARAINRNRNVFHVHFTF